MISARAHPPHEGTAGVSSGSLRAILARESASLLAIPGVLGTAEGWQDGEPVFVVFVERDPHDALVMLPTIIGGYPVAVRSIDGPRRTGATYH